MEYISCVLIKDTLGPVAKLRRGPGWLGALKLPGAAV